tara:strand:+ start:2956 stop:4170 length:1215 start_codon:yes stop_codon:yes gene_type:complete
MDNTKLRIGIDCLSVNKHYKGGVNSYLFGLLDGIQKLKNKDVEIILFCSNKTSFLFKKYYGEFQLVILEKYNKYLKIIFFIIPYILNSSKLWYLSNNIFNYLINSKKEIENKCDVLYTATTNLNHYNLNIPTIVSMHDIQHFHYPQNFTFSELIKRNLLFSNTAKYTSYFQASSNFIKKDILNAYKNINEQQVQVIREGVDVNKFSKTMNKNILNKFNLPHKFIFLPAQLWKHKNHITVIKAIEKLNKELEDICLVMTGAKYGGSNEIFEYIKKNNVRNIFYLGLVKTEEMVTLYQNAHVTICPAIYESSSLTLLESIAAGTNVIASDNPPNLEISENVKIEIFKKMNFIDLKLKIAKLWGQKKDEFEKVSLDNKKNIINFSWERIAEKYIDFILKVHNTKNNK